MVRSITLARALLVLGLLASSLALPGAASAANRKHHLSLNLGYQKYLSDDLKPIVDLGGGPTQLDFTNAGVARADIRASDLISIPIQAEFVYAKPADDVTGIGATVGITFNFGELH